MPPLVSRYATLVATVVLLATPCCGTRDDGHIPITTTHADARELYLEGRAMAESLRVTDARESYRKAAEADPSFALAQLGLANTAPTPKIFFESLERAVAASEGASEGERLMIRGLHAVVNGDPAGQLEAYTRLTELYPEDQRAQTLLGVAYFGRQDYPAAVEHLERAVAIDPSFSPAYNQLGYAYRFLGDLDRAESTFKKYTELLPNEPNPFDSYAELLMKRGEFDRSIEAYREALAIDPNFVASYVGIANDRMFQGRYDDARATLAELSKVARNDGERRAAHQWTAATRIHEGDLEGAMAEFRKMRGIADASGDFAAASGDAVLMGNCALAAGDYDGALAHYAEAVTLIDSADVPDEVKEATRRNRIYTDARVALERGDLDAAQTGSQAYTAAVATREIPFELRQAHDLAGRVALARGDAARAMAELSQASQQDPRVLYASALACRAAGDLERARDFADRAANFDGLSPNYAYVKRDAETLLGEL